MRVEKRGGKRSRTGTRGRGKELRERGIKNKRERDGESKTNGVREKKVDEMARKEHSSRI